MSEAKLSKRPPIKEKSSPVKKSASDSSTSHPTYSAMVSRAVKALDERGGSSRQAILKYIMKQFSLGRNASKVNSRLKLALRSGVDGGQLKQTTGTGATGRFRVVMKKPTTPKPKSRSSSTKRQPKKTAAKSRPRKSSKAPARKTSKSPAKKSTKSPSKAKVPAKSRRAPAKPKRRAPAKPTARKSASKSKKTSKSRR